MEEHIYIRDMANEELIGTEITDVYFCKNAEMVAKNEKRYSYRLILADKTGEIKGTVKSHLVKEEIKGKTVELNALIVMKGGKAELEIYNIFAKQEAQMSEEKKEKISEMLVSSVSKEYGMKQTVRLREIVDGIGEAYAKHVLHVLCSKDKHNPVVEMMNLPASKAGAFCYNGGLLDKAVYMSQMADVILNTHVPDGAYEQVQADKDIIKSALVLACAALAGRYSALPDNKESIAGMPFLPIVLSAFSDVDETIDGENVIHCIMTLVGSAVPVTIEAEICRKIWELTDVFGMYSYAEYTNKTWINGHEIRRKE